LQKALVVNVLMMMKQQGLFQLCCKFRRKSVVIHILNFVAVCCGKVDQVCKYAHCQLHYSSGQQISGKYLFFYLIVAF